MLTKDQVDTFRFKYGLTPPPDIAVTENSALEDIAIGAAKGFGKGVKGASDIGQSVARILTKPVIGAAANQTPEEQAADTQINEALAADNTMQKVGEAAEFVAEVASPFAWSKIAKLPAFLKGLTGAKPLLGTVKEGSSIESVARLADANKEVRTASEAVMKGEAPTEALKTAAESASVPVSFTEKLAGLAPDVKARIKGKGKLLSDYLNVMDARNTSDLVPTPLEYGASFADKAKTKMESLLSDTGSAIGQFRKKISTYQAPRDAFNNVRSAFEGELGKLNLTVQNGKIVKVPGRIAQTVSDAEIKAIQSLYDDLGIASQNPSLENLIDLRTIFDNKINFEKAAREASNSLDPLSRAVRKKVAQVAEQIVGKTEAKNLEDFSKFMDAYNDLRSYTDRKAGAEFLLKRVFSERGGDPRAVMETIRQYTGVDLIDHAQMARIATELSGNASTQGLFRQEITRAGLDVANLLKGNPVGAVDTLIQRGVDTLVDKRKIFQKAAQ